MIEYICDMVREVKKQLERREWEGFSGRLEVIRAELQSLTPKDFAPAGRAEFLEVRRKLNAYSALTENQWECIYGTSVGVFHAPGSDVTFTGFLNRLELLKKHGGLLKQQKMSVIADWIITETEELLVRVDCTLKQYFGPDVATSSRKFEYIANPILRKIIERDYNDLILRLFPSHCWKSVAILAGSILEGLLLDLLTRDPVRVADAMRHAPKRFDQATKRNVDKAITSDETEDSWMLENLIQVADKLKLLPKDWRLGTKHVIQDMRNYVHPRKEMKLASPVTEGEAYQTVGLLMRVCDHIEKNHP